MQYRTLGRTGLEVSTVSMGTWKSFDVRGPKEIEHVRALVTEALRCGVNLFDTAPMYGAAENVLGEVLKGRRRDVIVATKVLAYDQRSARTLIEESFRKLQVDVIDLMQIHNMSAWREVTPVLEEYKANGRIRFLGITDYRTSMFPEMMQAMRTGKFDTIQIPYNLGDRAAEREIIPLAKQLNLGVLVMTPIAPIFDRNRLLQPLQRQDLAFLASYGVTTPGQALLKYLLTNADVATLLPATSRLERVTENSKSADGPGLPSEVLRRLEGMLL
jgi:aryl-alcohol dehydrogenase-like predicted oxidoreductase